MSAIGIEGRSPTDLAFRRFGKNRRAIISFWVMAALGLATVLVPMVSPHDYRTQTLEIQKQAPSGSHWMGTDPNGRDLMVRSFMGGRISFAVGLLATAVSLPSESPTGRRRDSSAARPTR